MKSKVYFIPVNNSDDTAAVKTRLGTLIEKSGVLGGIARGYNVAVKVHFGEEGNTNFVKPAYAAVVCGMIIEKKATAFLSDTNTLYRGKRINSKEHLKLAKRHGFTGKATGVDIFIPDDTKKENVIDVAIGRKFIKTAKIARAFIDADAIIAVSHFKGHILTGFGGALKNLGMGCAGREGKLAQHCDIAPVVYPDKCAGCRACEKICPAGAICIENNRSIIDKSKCIGCANCIEACPTGAMFIDMKSGDEVQMKMVEYASAVLKSKTGRSGFLNFAVKISKECDCWGTDNPPVVSDVGILASTDPVSIDKASFDLVNRACGRDIFKEFHPEQNGLKQLEYAEELGMGNLDYELTEL